jgi:hypothetical protein
MPEEGLATRAQIGVVVSTPRVPVRLRGMPRYSVDGTATKERKEVTVPNDTLNASYHRRTEGDVMSRIVATLQPRSLRSARYAAAR